MLNLDQCLKIMADKAPVSAGPGVRVGPSPFVVTQLNPGGFGCYAPLGNKIHFNPGDGIDVEGSPNLQRVNSRQVCFCNPTTTTTPVPTTTTTTTTTTPVPTTTAAAMAPPEDDGVSAVVDPHLHPIAGEDFTLH